jgi:hypothetical protein
MRMRDQSLISHLSKPCIDIYSQRDQESANVNLIYAIAPAFL